MTVTATAINVSGILGSIITHASANNARYAIRGVLLRSSADGQYLVATDGIRLARFVAKTSPSDSIGWGDVIIPTDAIKSAKISKRTDSVRIVRDGDEWAIEAGPLRVRFKPIDGTFPSFEYVIPDSDRSSSGHIGLKTKYLADAMKLAGDFNSRYGGGSESIRFGIGTANQPVRLDASDGGKSLTIIIMPISPK